jgi:hypothetical protein
MSNIFTSNPVIVNTIGLDNEIIEKYIFIGNVPTIIKKEWRQIQKSHIVKNKTFEKFYNKSWLINFKKSLRQITGGDDYSFDDIEVDQFDISDNLNELKRKPLKTKDQSTITNQKQQKKGTTLVLIFEEYDGYNLSVYPIDSILTFKRKLALISKIPIYRQHLWYVIDGVTHALYYDILNNNLSVPIDALKIFSDMENKETKFIESIPINLVKYESKDDLEIKALDQFEILQNIYYKGTTEFNILDLELFIGSSRPQLKHQIKDKYTRDLMYYSFIIYYWPMITVDIFSDLINNPNEIKHIYPDLEPSKIEQKELYKKEKEITDTMYELVTMKPTYAKIRNKLQIGITDSILNVLSYRNDKDTNIILRNLFDSFVLTASVPSCKLLTIHDGKQVELSKTYKNEPPIKSQLDLNSLVYKINISITTINYLEIHIYENGNYVIKAKWSNEKKYNFDDIFKIVKNNINPIISIINKFDYYVFPSNKKMVVIQKNNTTFTQISMNVFYKTNLSFAQNALIKQLLEEFELGGIVLNVASSENITGYFSKGMYQFSSDRMNKAVCTSNYYGYLSNSLIKQKWDTVFKKTRSFHFIKRVTDMKIKITGLKSGEYDVFIQYIATLFYLFHNKKNKLVKEDNVNIIKKLKNLKQQDPILYDFKKIYNSNVIYSKICQKPYQPLLLNKKAFDKMTMDKKKNAVKYWNFTENTEAYYTCPNPVYKHIKFITGKHPKGFCIPCCLKTPVNENKESISNKIHQTCMKEHEYHGSKKTMTLGSKYIMTYKKTVEPGRLSRLPETTLEPLFYEIYSKNVKGVDPECGQSDGYYLYGVDQNISNIRHVGYLRALASAMEIPILDLLEKISQELKKQPDKFKILLNGNITNIFYNNDQLAGDIKAQFKPDSLSITKEVPWNDIVMDIMLYYFNITTILFVDNNKTIELALQSHIDGFNKLTNDDNKKIFILKKDNDYYPIYKLNTDLFFGANIITARFFQKTDDVVIIVNRLINVYFKLLNTNKGSDITLDTVIEFTKTNIKYKLIAIYINKSNLCYYVKLTSTTGDIYFPVTNSHYSHGEYKAIYTPYMRKSSKMTFFKLNTFIETFNKWITYESEKSGLIKPNKTYPNNIEDHIYPIYTLINFTAWVALTPNLKLKPTNKVIGFKFNNIIYYFDDMPLSKALKIGQINQKKVYRVLYDPDSVNKTIYNKIPAFSDARCSNIGISVYNSMLYRLLVLEFVYLFSKEINVSFRTKIKKIIVKSKKIDAFKKITNIIINNSNEEPASDDELTDLNKIQQIINSLNISDIDKNQALKQINEASFNFDKLKITKLKHMKHDDIVKYLKILSKSIVSIGNINKIKNLQFNNMIIPCSSKEKLKYCNKNKLIISQQKLNILLDILAADIKNPYKEKWLFSSIFMQSFIGWFRFIRRSNETIKITMHA